MIELSPGVWSFQDRAYSVIRHGPLLLASKWDDPTDLPHRGTVTGYIYPKTGMLYFFGVTRDPELCEALKDCIRQVAGPRSEYIDFAWFSTTGSNQKHGPAMKRPRNVTVKDHG